MEATQPAPRLTDGVVPLRRQLPRDRQRVYERSIDPETIKYTVLPVPYTLKDADEWIAMTNSEGFDNISWAIAVAEDANGHGEASKSTVDGVDDDGSDISVGAIDWRPLPGSGGRQGLVGFAIHPSTRRKGYLSRAVALMLGELHVRGATHVRWTAVLGNFGSLRTVWRAGWPVPTPVPGLHDSHGRMYDAWHSVLDLGARALEAQGPGPVLPWEEYLERCWPRDFVGVDGPNGRPT
jgi:RimJ/RimL family protein N-acetyltransferase